MLRRCLVLSVRDIQENSLIVTLVHPQLGKQEFLAKGGKRIAAKLTPWLGPLQLVNVWVASTRGTRAIIREVESLENLAPSGPLGLRLSLKIAALLEKALLPGVEIEPFFERVIVILRHVQKPHTSLEELKKLWIQFELLLLSFLGVAPPLEHLKGKNVNEASRFLAQRIDYFFSS